MTELIDSDAVPSAGIDVLDHFYGVTVNWNGHSDTTACVESLLTAGIPVERILVVDNSSSDASEAILQERFGGALQIVQMGRNAGYAAAANAGIRLALDAGSQWVYLVNNDTVVAPDILREFRHALKGHAELAMATPLILWYDDPERIWSAGDRTIAGTLLTRDALKGKHAGGVLPPVMPADFITGCGMLIRRSVFDRIGLFDESFFMYAEDADFCARASRAGFQMACVTGARMWHKVSRSSRQNPVLTSFSRVRNQIWFYRRYGRAAELPLLVVVTLVRCILLSIKTAIGLQPGAIGAILRGWVAGWFGTHPVGRSTASL